MAWLGSGLARGSIRVPKLRGASPTAPRTGARPDPTTSSELPLQIASFVAVRVTSTIAYVLLYLLLRAFTPAQRANVLSLLVTAIGFVLYRTWVFRGSRRADGQQVSHRKESVERDHLPGEAFEPHPAATRAKPGPAPAARA